MKAAGQVPPWPPGGGCSPQRPTRDFAGTVGKRESLFPLRWLETKEARRPSGHWREGSSLRWSPRRADGGGHGASRPLGPAPATHPELSDPQTTGTVPPQPQFCLTQFEVEFWPCNPKNPIIMSLRAMCVEGHFLMLGRKGGGTANSLGST